MAKRTALDCRAVRRIAARRVIAGERNLGCRKLIADHPDDVFVFDVVHDRHTPDDYALVGSCLVRDDCSIGVVGGL